MTVTLFSIYPDAPLVFHCKLLRANLTPNTCSTNYSRSLNLSCAHCSIGAEHVAAALKAPKDPRQDKTVLSKVNREGHQNDYALSIRRFFSQTCIRCSAKAMRLIEPGLCVSCLNRHAEVINGRNSKGTFPRLAAKSLYQCHALLAGEFSYLKNVLRHRSQCAPIVQRISGGAFVSGIFSGSEEFDKWLVSHYPDAVLLDFERNCSLAEITADEHDQGRYR
jgi:hypothetical protein